MSDVLLTTLVTQLAQSLRMKVCLTTMSERQDFQGSFYGLDVCHARRMYSHCGDLGDNQTDPLCQRGLVPFR